MLPAWSTNLGKRLVKSPTIYSPDTGLLCHLMGLDAARLSGDRSVLGHVLENLAVMGLRKQVGWSAERPGLFHFRTAAGHEVDIVLENARGEIIGIEVKSSATIRRDDFRGLRTLGDEGFGCMDVPCAGDLEPEYHQACVGIRLLVQREHSIEEVGVLHQHCPQAGN